MNCYKGMKRLLILAFLGIFTFTLGCAAQKPAVKERVPYSRARAVRIATDSFRREFPKEFQKFQLERSDLKPDSNEWTVFFMSRYARDRWICFFLNRSTGSLVHSESNVGGDFENEKSNSR